MKTIWGYHIKQMCMLITWILILLINLPVFMRVLSMIIMLINQSILFNQNNIYTSVHFGIYIETHF